ncbi:MAG: hypothetical protein R3B09_12595 [Nannocystaceae bacterium]
MSPPPALVACPACSLHVKRSEGRCPHCGSTISEGGAIARTATAVLMGLTLGCTGGEPQPEYGVPATESASMTDASTTEGTTDGSSGSASASSTSAGTSGTDSDTGTSGTSTSSTTTTSGSTTFEPDYGVPDTSGTTAGTGTTASSTTGTPMTTAEPEYGVPDTSPLR